jgi:hypothetical protein
MSRVSLTFALFVCVPSSVAQYASLMPIEVQLPSLQNGVEPEQVVSLNAMGVEGQVALLPVHLVTFILNKFEPAQYDGGMVEQIVEESLNVPAVILQQSPEMHWTQEPPEQ